MTHVGRTQIVCVGATFLCINSYILCLPIYLFCDAFPSSNDHSKTSSTFLCPHTIPYPGLGLMRLYLRFSSTLINHLPFGLLSLISLSYTQLIIVVVLPFSPYVQTINRVCKIKMKWNRPRIRCLDRVNENTRERLA